jgi:hypothetical protein
MAVEARRGCGYRKVGGLYLVGSGGGIACDRLPIALEVCGCCGQGIKPTRGWTWVDIAGLVGGDHMITPPYNHNVSRIGAEPYPCSCHPACPLCHNVAKMGKGGLLWIGAQFYPTIEHFEVEARALGISRRITTLPRGFELGKTWLLLAHTRGIVKPTGELKAGYVPAIFRVWKPERIERIYTESQRDSEAVQADIKRGITPVFVPDNDKDHQGSVYDKGAEEAADNGSETPALFGNN